MLFEKPTAKLPIVFTANPKSVITAAMQYVNSFLNKPVRFFSIKSRASQIVPVNIQSLDFESEVYTSTELTHEQLIARISAPDNEPYFTI